MGIRLNFTVENSPSLPLKQGFLFVHAVSNHLKLTQMRKLYILSISSLTLSLVLNNSFAQPNPEWVTRYDGPVNKADEIRAMKVANGFVYVTGPSDGAKKGNIDYVTIKYDLSGHQVWTARYNGTGNGEDWPYAIAVDVAGNVYVTGRSMGASGSLDYATVKYDAGGAFKWAARYNSVGNRADIPVAIAVDAGGNVFVTGSADCPTGSFTGNIGTTIKYGPLGNEISRDSIDLLPNSYTSSAPREQGNSIAMDASGNVFVAGISGTSGLIVKYDANLQRQWINTIPGSDIHKVLTDALNNIIATGWSGQTFKYDPGGTLIWQATKNGAAFWDMALDPSGNVYVTGEGSDYLTTRYDGNDGHEVWSQIYVGSGNGPDFARSIALDGSGNVYVTGHCTTKSGKSVLEVAGTIKINSSGIQQWASVYDSTNKLVGDGFVVATDTDGNVYVAGQGISNARGTDFDFLTLRYSQGSNGFVTKHSDDVAENNNIALFSLQSYPNPFISSTTIQYQLPHDGKVKLAIYDLSGKEIATLVNETKPVGIYKFNFDAVKLSSGTYLCKLQCGDLTKTKELIVLK